MLTLAVYQPGNERKHGSYRQADERPLEWIADRKSEKKTEQQENGQEATA